MQYVFEPMLSRMKTLNVTGSGAEPGKEEPGKN
jgi:hypothetical protein